MAGNDLTFRIFGKDVSASKAIDGVSKKLGGMGPVGVGVGAAIGTAVGGVAVQGINALGDAFVGGFSAASRYQQLADKSAAVIKSTGNAANISVAGIQARAAALESMSGVDEEMIINGQNVLATFTKIKNGVGAGNDIFNQGTTAALNMSTALGMDMQGAATMVGKALNDPVKGIAAMSKAGIQFTAEQRDQIKTMVESGDTMGAQKMILGELETQFGGAAEAAGKGFGGDMARAKDSVDDAMRSVATGLLPAIGSLARVFTNDVMPAIVGTFSFVNQHKGLFAAVAAGVFLLVAAGWAQAAVLAVQSGRIKEWVAQTVIVRGATALWSAMNWLLNASLLANPITWIVLGVIALVAVIILIATKTTWFQTIFDTAMHVVKAAFGFVMDKARALWGWIKQHWPLLLAILTGPFGLAVLAIVKNRDKIKDAVTAAKDWIVSKFDAVVEFMRKLPGKLTSALKTVGTAILAPFKTAFNAIGSLWNNTVGKIHFTVPNWVPKFGGNGFSFPTIPGLATGGTITRGGLTLVGENGPELRYMPRGASVIPLPRRTGSAPSQAAPTVVVQVSGAIVGDKYSLAKYVSAALDDARRRGVVPA